jgi:hypothetical protein
LKHFVPWCFTVGWKIYLTNPKLTPARKTL